MANEATKTKGNTPTEGSGTAPTKTTAAQGLKDCVDSIQNWDRSSWVNAVELWVTMATVYQSLSKAAKKTHVAKVAKATGTSTSWVAKQNTQGNFCLKLMELGATYAEIVGLGLSVQESWDAFQLNALKKTGLAAPEVLTQAWLIEVGAWSTKKVADKKARNIKAIDTPSKKRKPSKGQGQKPNPTANAKEIFDALKSAEAKSDLLALALAWATNSESFATDWDAAKCERVRSTTTKVGNILAETETAAKAAKV